MQFYLIYLSWHWLKVDFDDFPTLNAVNRGTEFGTEALIQTSKPSASLLDLKSRQANVVVKDHPLLLADRKSTVNIESDNLEYQHRRTKIVEQSNW